MIIKLAFDFNIGLSRIKRDSGHPFCAIHLVRLTDIYGAGTVVIGGKCIIDWRVGGWPVMLGPVKFDSAGDPWSGEPDEGGFDHMIVIDKIVSVRLIVGPLDPAAQFRKHTDL